MKIIFVGDSMGLPREGCEYEDTYFYKFQKRLIAFLFSKEL